MLKEKRPKHVEDERPIKEVEEISKSGHTCKIKWVQGILSFMALERTFHC